MSGPAKIFLVQGQYLDNIFFTSRRKADDHVKYMRLTTGYRHWHAYAYVPAKKAGRRQGADNTKGTSK